MRLVFRISVNVGVPATLLQKKKRRPRENQARGRRRRRTRPLRKTAAAYLEVLVVAWMEEKVCLSIIFLKEKKNLLHQENETQ